MKNLSSKEFKSHWTEKAPDTQQLLKEGDSAWLAGQLVKDKDNVVALKSGMITSIVSKDDLLEVDQDDDQVFVRVSADANIVTRFDEVVTKAGPGPVDNPSACDCDKEGDNAQLTSLNLPASGLTNIGVPTVPLPPRPVWPPRFPICRFVITYRRVCIFIGSPPRFRCILVPEIRLVCF